MIALISLLLLIVLQASSPVDAKKCPELYKRYSAQHTFCLPANRSCSILKRGVTEQDKKMIVKLQNDYRNKVATGQERRGGGMPSAANMLELVWDNELASVAQKLTETCNYGHDCNKCRRVQAYSVGQNIGRVYGSDTAPPDADWPSFMKGLYEEVSVFNKNYRKPYKPGPHDEKTQYGHFTQMVWATSWRVGCGWSLFKEGDTFTSYTACNFGPGGNVPGGEMYKAGRTCSACPKNSCCGQSCKQKGITATYPGLCKVVDPSMPPEGHGPDGDDYLFYCDFNGQPDCDVTSGGKPWKMVKTPGGNWMSIVLNGGEKINLKFKKTFEGGGKLCGLVLVRRGPTVDGKAVSGNGKSMLDFGSDKGDFPLETDDTSQDFTQTFLDVDLPEQPYKIKYSFEYQVPRGASPQFVEIKQVSVKKC